MPDETDAAAGKTDRAAPALALSGGGFRATLFHCGALWRLNELGQLPRLSRISSVSGGSIASGMLASAWPSLTFVDGVATDFVAKVVAPLRVFCRRSIDTMAVGWGSVLPGRSIGEVLAGAYDELYERAGTRIGLQDLPDSPQFLFNATNLQTGRLVRMEKRRLADYTIGMVPRPRIGLGTAVAASSAFPPVLSPVVLDVDPAAWLRQEGSIHHGDPAYTKSLSLTDGGVYDNLGLETVDAFDPVIVSDAGAPFGTEATASALWPKQALRALDIATDQTRALRKRLLFAEARSAGRRVVFAGIDGDLLKYPAPRTLTADPALVASLAGLRTRLDPFSDQEQGRLINWGWLMMDVALRSYLVADAPVPQAFPLPEWPLGRL